ncbi:MAG: protein kinase [Planctomyces sp.]|nr:protein kinase [Planctomyces sp.]
MEVQSKTARTIFLNAVENYKPEQWPELLEVACGSDPRLRNDVERLLKAYDPSSQFMASPAANQLAVTLNSPEFDSDEASIGKTIDRYKLLERIGEGGMGAVYMAMQSKPIQRKVALKIIKSGMDSKEFVSRFEAERQALALMNHPNIARVLDGGTTAHGVPYFVMELVRGIPITEFCDKQKLGTRERVQLLISVCDAVQHAHQKGIIHRDLKPSNILVEMHDVKPVPKVIDFGVAKAIGQQLSENTLYTGFHAMVGTPLYMSPEQAGQSSLDVDTRSDVYSLGVLLYELLTGETPFSRETIRNAGYDEFRKMIREVEPPSPSARFSTLENAARSTISGQRQIDPAKLTVELRGELDWITMKAIEKDRTRRYETPNALAADLQRYLDDEPVIACPPSAAYRFRKVVRKHRAWISIGAALSLAILAGSVIAGWQANRATRAERQATAYFTKSLDAIDLMVSRVGSKELIDVPAMNSVRYLVIQDAVRLYLDLLQTSQKNPRVVVATANALRRLSQEELHFDRYTDSEATIRQSLTVLNELQSDDRSAAAANTELGFCYQLLGDILNRQGKYADAKIAFQSSLEAFGSLPADFNDRAVNIAGVKMSLAQSEFKQGAFSKARQLLTETLEVHEAAFRKSPGYWWALAVNLEWLGLLAEQDGNLSEALDYSKRSFDVAEQFRIALEEPSATGSINDVSVDRSGGRKSVLFFQALAAGRVGHNHRQLKQFHESSQSYLQMLSICNTLVQTYPGVPGFLSQQRVALENLPIEIKGETVAQKRERLVKFRQLELSHSNEHIVRGRLAESLGDLDLALSDFRQAADMEPENTDIQLTYVFFLQNKLGDLQGALSYTEELCRKHPEKAAYLLAAAGLDQSLGNRARSLERFQKATEVEPQSGDAWIALATALRKSGDVSGSRTAMERAIQCPNTTSRFWVTLGEQLTRQGETERAIDAFSKAVEISPGEWWIRKRRSNAFLIQKQYEEALNDLSKAIEINPSDVSTLTWARPEIWLESTEPDIPKRLIALADRVIFLNSESSDAFIVRAVLNAAFKEFENSDQDFRRAIEADPENAVPRYKMALAQLASGRIPEYRQSAESLTDFALQKPTADNLYWACWTCSLYDTQLPQLVPLLKAAMETSATVTENTNLHLAIGALQFRMGQHTAAESVLMSFHSRPTADIFPGYVSVLLAMNHSRLGKTDQAGLSLADARKLAEEEDDGVEFVSWNRRWTIRLLIDEATGLINPPTQ